MKLSVFLIAILFINSALSQEYYRDSILTFQSNLNEEYKDPDKTPLSKKDLKSFKGHDFYPIDKDYRIIAEFERIDSSVPFLMKTTTNRLPTYEIYGVASFELNNQKFKLNIYQSHSLRDTEEYKNYLFLPFTDLTNGDKTYGGGRFIDLKIPDGDTIVIDFNKAYNPFCAYSPNYSCPIPPKENHLSVSIPAGIKLSSTH